MYKIDSNNKDLQNTIRRLFEWYDEYLIDENLKKVLVKLRDTKPDTITNDEGEDLINAYNSYQTLMEELGVITEILYPED